ncbi:MAG: preprotein translocase subunit SecA [Candidatus Fluviicola riflensis]|nr:MAG: preprotein translocase subunit SecA [Candidatus Fluviicola riflensis]OGS80016.1 MAG: preprotein translocase subunit SecA [Candidatus Fluviicola riflensis]OGS82531.1 MAG: preprotein translocase subunit SecA [Fluviicola sp. RIFCSPHIGHO2_01_FULL_43_53]OGS88195.1 MAG: preprotein translocase subunit SecA [Fluviicola sp. RIFCSPHIGHO2_12_FULL_43_24]
MESANTCYCGSLLPFSGCCEPLIKGLKKAGAAEQLMRSRYSAYCTIAVDYLLDTTHPSTRKYYSKKTIKEWAEQCTWLKLEIHDFTTTTVTFSAHFLDENRIPNVHREHSTFQLENGTWYFVDGKVS